jgi:hypothetical protein
VQIDNLNEKSNRLYGVAGTDPIQGLSVELPDTCPQCSAAVATVGPGREPHKASLRCTACGRHRGWLSLATWSFIHEIANKFGRPDAPIKIGRGNFQPTSERTS